MAAIMPFPAPAISLSARSAQKHGLRNQCLTLKEPPLRGEIWAPPIE